MKRQQNYQRQKHNNNIEKKKEKKRKNGCDRLQRQRQLQQPPPIFRQTSAEHKHTYAWATTAYNDMAATPTRGSHTQAEAEAATITTQLWCRCRRLSHTSDVSIILLFVSLLKSVVRNTSFHRLSLVLSAVRSHDRMIFCYPLSSPPAHDMSCDDDRTISCRIAFGPSIVCLFRALVMLFHAFMRTCGQFTLAPHLTDRLIFAIGH